MTADRDPDRTIRAWLDQMADEAPDRVIDAVLMAVERTPQARRPNRRVSWRHTTVNRTSLLAAGAAIAAIVVVAALLARPPSNPDIGASPSALTSPSPQSTVSTTPSPTAAGFVPTTLTGRWMGGPRAVVGSGMGTSLIIASDSFALGQPNDWQVSLVHGTAEPASPTALNLSTTAGVACLADGPGRYAWSLSPSGRVLTLTATSESCVPRGALLAGTWWKMACIVQGTGCLGDLDPGTYASQYVRPLPLGTEPWSPRFGGVTYSVPSGWANYTDWPTQFGLTTASAFAATTPASPDPQMSVDLLTGFRAEDQSPPCSGKPQPGVAPTVAAQLGALRRMPGLKVSPPTSITIDGHSGAYVDIVVDASTIKPCGTAQIVEYLIAAGAGQAIDAQQRQRLIVLGIGGGQMDAILIQAASNQFDSFVAAAMPIVTTFHFQ